MRRELPDITPEISASLHIIRDWHLRLSQRHDRFSARVDEIRRLLQHLEDHYGTRQVLAGARDMPGGGLPSYSWAITPIYLEGDCLKRGFRFTAPVEDLDLEDAAWNPEEAADMAVHILDDYGFATSAEELLEGELSDQLELLSFEDRTAAWQADTASLSDQECALIIKAADQNIRSEAPGRGAVLCAASLLYGRRIDQLAGHPVGPDVPGNTYWTGQGFRFRPDVTGSSGRLPNGIEMLAPPSWREAFDAVYGQPLPALSELYTQAHSWLHSCDGLRPIRLSSLARALSDGLACQSEDLAISGLLCGKKVEEMTQLYYASFSAERLNEAWQQHQTERLGLASGKTGTVKRMGSRKMIGSLQAPSRKEVRAFFTDLAQKHTDLQARKGQEGLAIWPDLHAAVTNLSLSVLLLATARRPHGPAFDPLSEVVGRHRRRILVADKGGRLRDGARWLPLPAMAWNVILDYQQHLRRMRAEIAALLDPESLRLIDGALLGKGALFFVLPELYAPSHELTSAEFWARIKTPGNKPRNWARHYMRRELSLMGITGARIDSYMGHGGSLGDPMQPTSLDSLAAGDDLSAVIESILEEALQDLPQGQPI